MGHERPQATAWPGASPDRVRGPTEGVIAGQLLAGRHKGFRLGQYAVLDLLGRGGMGAVYEAEQRGTGRGPGRGSPRGAR